MLVSDGVCYRSLVQTTRKAMIFRWLNSHRFSQFSENLTCFVRLSLILTFCYVIVCSSVELSLSLLFLKEIYNIIKWHCFVTCLLSKKIAFLTYFIGWTSSRIRQIIFINAPTASVSVVLVLYRYAVLIIGCFSALKMLTLNFFLKAWVVHV